MLNAYIFAGPSGSGKTTLVEELRGLGNNLVIISPDYLRELLTGDINDQSANGAIFTAAVPALIDAMATLEKDIVIDATNTTKKARGTLIKQFKSLSYNIIAHVFHVPIEECKRRNAARGRVVPEFVIDRQFAQWQEPSLEEGIDKIVIHP